MSRLIGEGSNRGHSGPDSGQGPSLILEEASGRQMQAVAAGAGVGPAPDGPGLAVSVPEKPLGVWGGLWF